MQVANEMFFADGLLRKNGSDLSLGGTHRSAMPGCGQADPVAHASGSFESEWTRLKPRQLIAQEDDIVRIQEADQQSIPCKFRAFAFECPGHRGGCGRQYHQPPIVIDPG